MAEDHLTNQENSGGGESSCVQKVTGGDAVDQLGYETPSSEEHRIPPVDWSRPPPAPRKRKRLVVRRKKVRALEMFEDGVLTDEELEIFFGSFTVAEFRVPAAARPEGNANGGAKKRRLGV